MRQQLSEEHIPEDPTRFWAELAGDDGLKFHRSLYNNGPARLRLRLMFTLCEATTRASCIDVGCGAGAVTQGLAQMFGEVFAFDSCPELIADAPQFGNVRYRVVDADDWEPDARYTVAFLSEILEHVRRPQRLVQVCAQACDYLIASSPIGDPLCDERAFDIEARGNPKSRADGAGHIWTWDGDGFFSLFPRVVFAGNLMGHMIVMATTI